MSTIKLSLAAKSLCECSSVWANLDEYRILASLKKYLASKNAPMFWHMNQNAYPSDRYANLSDRYANPSDAPILSSLPSGREAQSWAADHTNNIENSKAHVLHKMTKLCKLADDAAGMDSILRYISSDYVSATRVWDGGGPGPAKEEGALIILPLALRSCIRWLEDPSFFHTLGFDQKSYARGALRYQLHEVRIYVQDASFSTC